ncbi:MAG TPA: hypothetical protein PLW97_07165 [Synergistaceae bacterium]|nr:hypothetical protein [Synergistaceae bacterium]HPQ37411.1 hypothetical protein [Synergistaceae bacterium]
MIRRRDVVLPCLAGSFIVALLYKKSLIGAIQGIFNGLMAAGTDLLDIMLVIGLMVAMLQSLRTMGADYRMIAPVRRFMSTPTRAFFILGTVIYVAALFFWPTPATALVGTLLIPAAIASGLPLTGALAQALGTPLSVNIPVLASIGQMGALWAGGGTLVAWSFGLVATAGIAQVDPLELARKNFIPVSIGLATATVVGIFMM